MGRKVAPSTRSVDMSGNSSCASVAEMRSSGSPKVSAQATWRSSSSSRSGDDASRMPPHSTQPGSVSGSAASSRYSSALRIIIRVRFTEPRSWPTSPAEWNVEPLVSSPRSSTTTSVTPLRARWCAMLAPPTPPPTMTMRARPGSCAMNRFPSVVGQSSAARPSSRRS